ncbi:MAG: hypothetical protein CL916_01815 [Deltaproteobacteria bacterium]|nr:hypothetical protein [Deltaproteobacteria bacterium]
MLVQNSKTKLLHNRSLISIDLSTIAPVPKQMCNDYFPCRERTSLVHTLPKEPLVNILNENLFSI